MVNDSISEKFFEVPKYNEVLFDFNLSSFQDISTSHEVQQIESVNNPIKDKLLDSQKRRGLPSSLSWVPQVTPTSHNYDEGNKGKIKL